MNTAMAKTESEPRFLEGEGRRRCMRVALHRGGTARCTFDAHEHIAFVRDFNFSGIFFFSDFAPEVGSSIEVEFSVPDSHSYKRFAGNGVVIRVEQAHASAVGVAVRLSHCELLHDHI